ncbi:MAG: hypothetical protein COZ34_04315 [Candidatus Pacebacteria bacterium CG_4_10_14_3_um_filter_34_15]|nr:hypothetical protein [Candidatus Pacearchaeota archaeon]NCQ65467.1 hypothetical protein [Candidatus Paceibacterota bacterium]OIO45132.1 MAG: hypothetical protein AUJ41_00725 [Candidatus Pacebacteria bacterium CG1_02_43_31]PIQ81374.1 MAG: hypothetical protein COV78_00575 [Candidatus Pacebacteria bacterium CG11_big_fil_rev_8_21_14_0_20_34_55]PIX81217.1 MAG: hypothetical protein COZ34_04315 [Candidatus Pacebacteria bacterium CG_4_10_14_3_um_filter_34_15]PJC43308.1 MAG: hypothetical protein CO0
MKNLKIPNTKVLAIIGVLLLVVGIGIFVKTRSKDAVVAEAPKLKKTKITEPLNVIDVSDRPYVVISPNSDGKNITIAVNSVKKDASAVDYELEYQAGSLLQGVFGSINLGQLPASTKQLLGSCSAGGACTYHEDVKGGHLTTRFNGKENYALKSEWKYAENKKGDDALSSTDAKFQITSKELKSVKLAVVFNTPGYPEKIDGIINSDPYSLQTIPEVSGKATLTMRAKEEGDLVILGWNGTKWTEFTGKVDGKSITAEVDLMELYVVVSK